MMVGNVRAFHVTVQLEGAALWATKKPIVAPDARRAQETAWDLWLSDSAVAHPGRMLLECREVTVIATEAVAGSF